MEDVGTGGKARLLGGIDLFLLENFNKLGSFLSVDSVVLFETGFTLFIVPSLPLKCNIFDNVFLIFFIFLRPPPRYSSKGCDNRFVVVKVRLSVAITVEWVPPGSEVTLCVTSSLGARRDRPNVLSKLNFTWFLIRK